MATTSVTKKPTAAELEARAAQRQKVAEDKVEIYPIPQNLMDGMGDDGVFGNGLKLHIKALPIKHQRRVQQGLYEAWPFTLIVAARSDLHGKGIPLKDTAQVTTVRLKTSMMIQFQQAKEAYEKRLLEATEDNPVTDAPPELQDIGEYPIEAVIDDINSIRDRLEEESDEELGCKPVAPNTTRLVDDLAASIWPVVQETPGLTAESLAGELEDKLTIEDLTDLLRAILRAYGTHPGCMADRFTPR